MDGAVVLNVSSCPIFTNLPVSKARDEGGGGSQVSQMLSACSTGVTAAL